MDSAVAGNLNQAQIQSLVGNAVGLDPARGDAITVASMPFDTTAAKQAAADLAAAKAADASAQMWSMIKTGGIAGGILLVILLVWLRSRRREEVEEDYEPLELSDDMLAELDRLRIASIREEVKPRSTTGSPGARGRRAAEGPRGDLRHGQREARRGRRHAPRLAERAQGHDRIASRRARLRPRASGIAAGSLAAPVPRPRATRGPGAARACARPPSSSPR